jgi:hypothetical protein
MYVPYTQATSFTDIDRWCGRCNRFFRTYRSYDQHVQTSSRHWQCPAQCGEDCFDWDDLLEHCEENGCAAVCRGCDGGAGKYFLDDNEYWEHVDLQNVCTECGRHFDHVDNLHQVHADYKPATTSR